jgi:serine/threonine protein phosphatase 1
MRRKIVIGDIHGAYKALVQLMERVQPQPGDELVFLGDYVDGWSESARVVDYLIALGKQFTCTFIKGNHDDWAERWLKTGIAEPAEWVRNGGEQTMSSYNGYDPTQINLHLAFFDRLQYFVIDSANRLFVHAGFTGTQGPSKEHFPQMFFWDRTLWELALATDESLPVTSPFFPKRLKIFSEIFIGHTPTTNYGVDLPMHAHNVWNVDTGAAFRGRISAVDVDSKSFWQSDQIFKLYPDEKGRNK